MNKRAVETGTVNKEFMNKLDRFRMTAYELMTIGEKVSPDLFNLSYPFSRSLDEIVVALHDWADHVARESAKADKHGVLVAHKDNESAIVLSKYDRGSSGSFYIVDNKGYVEAWPESHIKGVEVEPLANWGFDTIHQAESTGAIVRERVDD